MSIAWKNQLEDDWNTPTDFMKNKEKGTQMD